MLPLAPDLFSTTTPCGNAELKPSAMRRAMMSDPFPGGKGTTNRTGRDGGSNAAIAGADETVRAPDRTPRLVIGTTGPRMTSFKAIGRSTASMLGTVGDAHAQLDHRSFPSLGHQTRFGRPVADMLDAGSAAVGDADCFSA